MTEIIAKNITKLRKKNGITQQELGESLGISNRAVSNWEMEISTPTIDNLYRLSKIFNVPMEYFFEDLEQVFPERKTVGMQTMRELYKIGRGPSSSHTIGPEKACKIFKEKNKDADSFKAILYGSLAKTGKGHGTDKVIKTTLAPFPCEIEFNLSNELELPHPNTMDLIAFRNKEETDRIRIMSVGGGNIVSENEEIKPMDLIYSLTTFDQIKEYCEKKNIRLWQYVIETEDKDFYKYMTLIWETMKDCIQRGLEDEGVLPGGLNVQKKAKFLFNQEHIDESRETKENRLICSYAFAVSEQNASSETIVTAPTCGASGVLPAALYYQQQKKGYSDDEIIKALMTAGIIGNLIKTNASISGAECGCQAEVGAACAMTAAALAELFELNLDKIEYAAEIAIEHHLGLTCDPICGLVQIPCIERNAVASMRALNAVNLASFLSSTRKISLDKVIHTMKETGRDLSNRYKETSEAGLAKIDVK